MQPESQTSILDTCVQADWQKLMPDRMGDGEQLFPRFAAYYTYLKALPRRVRKALQRQWRMPLAGVALMLALGQSPALAATIPVNASCTLINAITAANTDSTTGGCPAGSGADIIVLPAGSTQTLIQVNNSTYGPTGLPVISSVITIEGQGSTIRRDSGAPQFRIIAMNGSGHLTLKDTTVSGGVATPADRRGGGLLIYGGTAVLMNTTISGNTALGRCAEGICVGGHGGGISMLGGSITLMHSTVSGNSTTDTCPPEYFYCYRSRGGGIYARNTYFDYSIVTVTVLNSIITGNSADIGGGLASDGILTIVESIISENEGPGVNSGGFGPVSMATIVDSAISGNIGSGVETGYTMSVSNSTIFDNAGVGIFFSGFDGSVFNSTISGNAFGGVGISGTASVAVTNSIIAGNAGSGVSTNGGTATMLNTTIMGNSAAFGGGGVDGFNATVMLLNSTIERNSAYAGGVANGGPYGLVVVTNSTISGNIAHGYGGGISNSSGSTLIMLNSTISGNSAELRGGGVENGSGLTVAHTLISGNIASTGREIFNDVTYGSVTANDHNLFGFNGNAGVVGFAPGPTDIVPPAGVQVSTILNPVLAFNGGPTATHALIPGSPTIDAGGPACTDANGNPLLTDQRGKPRIIDGNGDGIGRCDIGAFEFFPTVNNLVTLDPGLDTSFDPTPIPSAPAGTFTIGATFSNTSGMTLRFPFLTVTELSGGNLLLNAEEGRRGVGATVTPNVGDQVLSPGETVQVNFIVGLQTSTPFTFFVDLFAEPLVSGSLGARQRPSVGAKRVRR